jgi:hypothetical protein
MGVIVTILELTTLNKNKAQLNDLLEEKNMMEKRLQQLGYDGDCAYEKAMVAFYRRRLDMFEDLIRQAG